LFERLGNRITRTGHAFSRDIINKPARRRSDRGYPLRRGRRCNQTNPKRILPNRLFIFANVEVFFWRQIEDEKAVDSGICRIPLELVDAIP
jgi:hypothetical protein